MLNRLFVYLKGYLRIRVSGDSVERFINTCTYKGIHIWNLTSQNHFYEMNISVKDFKKLRPVIRKTKTKLFIVTRTGFPFFIQKYHYRKMFFPGMFLFVIIIFFLSSFIWNIKIEGNYSYSTENILEFLSAMDIKRGVKHSDINCSLISKELRNHYDGITWVSTSLKGSNLIIQMKENDNNNLLSNNHETEKPYDIIAEDSFKVTKIIVRKGIVMVAEGDMVKKGDILVSGQIPIYNDSKEIIDYQYCISDADIYGKESIEYSDEISFTKIQKEYLPIKKQQYYLCFQNQRFQFGSIKNNYENFETRSKEKSFGDFRFGIRSVIPYVKKRNNYTLEKIQELLTENFSYYCQELEKKGVEIIKNNVKIYTWSDKAIAKGILTIELPIGRKVKSQDIETGDYIDGNDGNNN